MQRFALPPLTSRHPDLPKLTKFVPFDPAKKTSEATATDAKGGVQRIIKGAFTVSRRSHGSVAHCGRDS